MGFFPRAYKREEEREEGKNPNPLRSPYIYIYNIENLDSSRFEFEDRPLPFDSFLLFETSFASKVF